MIQPATGYLPDTLRSLRTKFQLTQKQVAEALGVSERTVYAWETDSSNMKYEHIRRLESLYGVSQDCIFFGRESSFSELLRNRKGGGNFDSG